MQPVNIRYLVAGEKDGLWGLTVHSLGRQNIPPLSPYPPRNHPNGYFFTAESGRILQEYQLLYITAGSGTFFSKSSGERHVRAGNLFILFPGEWHTYRPDKCGWNEYWIGFSGKNMDDKVSAGLFDKHRPVLNVGINDEIVALYQRAIEVGTEQAVGYQYILGSLVENILGLAWSLDARSGIRNTAITRLINEAKALMVEGIYDKMSPETVADRLNMGYTSFRKQFKKHTGLSPLQYQNELRIQKAKELLRSTTQSIAEISFNLNFTSTEYFFTAFKRYTSMTPIQYRKLSQSAIGGPKEGQNGHLAE